jgi:MFS family permease
MAERAPWTVLDMDRRQWAVLLAAWVGWGFDVFDALLFTYVAPDCVPTLLRIPLGSPEARRATIYWAGVLTSVLLVGWAAGGVLFGRLADRIGRQRTLLLTMVLYGLGTGACAAAPDLATLVVFRAVASLGIGGEWAAGAAMVAEVVPENRRVDAAVLLFTASPVALFLASAVDYTIAGVLLANAPHVSWRFVFLCGLVPAALALAVRRLIPETARWQSAARSAPRTRLRELFSPDQRARTASGFAMAVVALVTWWSCNAFIPIIASGLAQTAAHAHGLSPRAATVLAETWKARATNLFNLGGLAGALLTAPVAKRLGRKKMFALYFGASALALLAAFGADLSPPARLWAFGPVGLAVYGVFGSFTYYLPELFPTRLRATGAGFCYNVGRLLAASGPWLIGSVAARGAEALPAAMRALVFLALIPLGGCLLSAWVVETRGRPLPE